MADDNLAAFATGLDRIPVGYGDGWFDDRRYGVALDASGDRRRRWLYAEQLGGTDRISFNLYVPTDRRLALRPCEIPAAKAIEFVLRHRRKARQSAAPPLAAPTGEVANARRATS